MRYLLSNILLCGLVSLCSAQGKFGGGNGGGYASATINNLILSEKKVISKATAIRYYPNPTRDIVHLSRSSNWQVINSTGQVLLSDHDKRISLEKLKAGIYFIRLENKQFIRVTKINE